MSAEEEDVFYPDGADYPTITADQFRLDLSRSLDHPFNREAQDVFVEDFLEAINERGWYSVQAIPAEFLKEYIVLEVLNSHLKHVYAMYREVRSRKRKELWTARVGRAARNSRKGSVGSLFSKLP